MLDSRQRLIDMAEPEIAAFNQKLIPGEHLILGVRTPLIKQLAKEIAREDFRTWLAQDEPQYYEEYMLRGQVIAAAKMDSVERLEYIRDFLPLINNWSVCDSFCAALKFTSKNKEAVWAFIQPYFDSDQEFEIRFALVMAMDYYIEPEYIQQILEHCDSITNDAYYVRMAVAWVLSFCFIKQPGETWPYLRDNHLDDFTYNKALQKICESFRVSDADKDVIRSMKRKK